MTIKLKLIYRIFISGLLSLIVVSCDSLAGVNITEKSQMEKLYAELADLLDKDALVSEITFSSADDRVKDVMGAAVINYTNPADKETPLSMVVNLESRTVSKDESVKKKKAQKNNATYGILLQNIDLSGIPEIINNAADSLRTHDMSYAGVRQFSVIFEDGDNQPIYRFTLDGQPNGSGITTKGRFSAIYYHEVYFTLGTDGKLTVKVDDKLKTKRSGI